MTRYQPTHPPGACVKCDQLRAVNARPDAVRAAAIALRDAPDRDYQREVKAFVAAWRRMDSPATSVSPLNHKETSMKDVNVTDFQIRTLMLRADREDKPALRILCEVALGQEPTSFRDGGEARLAADLIAAHFGGARQACAEIARAARIATEGSDAARVEHLVAEIVAAVRA